MKCGREGVSCCEDQTAVKQGPDVEAEVQKQQGHQSCVVGVVLDDQDAVVGVTEEAVDR